jgi:predicted nuclease with TOPRIM domain
LSEELSKTVKEAAWRLILPEIRQIVKEELQASTGEIRGEIKALKGEMQGMKESLNTKIDEMDKRLSEKIDDLDKRLDIVQRLSVLEAKVREQEKSH